MSWGDVQFDKRPASKFVSSLHRALASTKTMGRLLMVYVGVVVPVMSFLMAADDPPNAPQWQSGALYAHLSYLLTARAGFVFYPLMAYAMVCFVMALLWRERFAGRFVVRLGVYSGVLLGLHYCVLLNISMIEARDWLQVGGSLPFVAMFAAVAGVIGVSAIQLVIVVLAWLVHLIGRKALVWSIGVSIISILALSVILQSADGIGLLLAPLVIAFFVSLMCGPFWFTAAYAYLAIDLTRRHWDRGQFRLWQLLFVFTWLGGYLAACRAAVDLAWAEYAKLPTEPPGDCYIATAAARGHPRFVGSRKVVVAGRQTMLVNRQLQVFKCAEIALRALCPRLHGILRRTYDRIGPMLARRMAHPLSADVAYLTLLPAQLIALALLRLLWRDAASRSKQLYCRAQVDDATP